MDQRRYIFFAAMILIVGAGIYFAIKKFTSTKVAYNRPITVDYVENDSLPKSQWDGKMLFMQKCASCHAIFKNTSGPALAGVNSRGPWTNTKRLYSYIKKPETFNKNKYVDSLRRVYGFNHMSFPDLTDDEITVILKYINDQHTKAVPDVIVN